MPGTKSVAHFRCSNDSDEGKKLESSLIQQKNKHDCFNLLLINI